MNIMVIFSEGVESVFVVTDDGIEIVHRAIEHTKEQQDKRS